MADVPQTRKMACAIIANAMVFHDRVAGIHADVRPLSMVCGAGVANPKAETIAAWNHILEINYWPIFAIARDVVTQLPSREAARILRRLYLTAGEVESSGASVAHDLTGRIFQRLIADRKYLATFYTLPASAALLARVAVAKMGVDWSDAEAIGGLRIGDFACGTGALLSAVYERVAVEHESAGGDSAKLHPAMMEEVLYGCDVMPSAIHITGSTLSGMQPTVGFGQSRLYTMPYGRQENGSVAIGSLELLQSSTLMTLFNMSDPVLRTGSAGEETAAQALVEAPDGGFDLVIMNPPFTSNTKHYDAGDGVLNAAFAAFDASEKDQSDMAKILRRRARGTGVSRTRGAWVGVRGVGGSEGSRGRRDSFRSAVHGDYRFVVGEVQGDDSDAVHGCDDIEHRGEWAGYVVFVGYGDRGVFGGWAQGEGRREASHAGQVRIADGQAVEFHTRSGTVEVNRDRGDGAASGGWAIRRDSDI